MGAVRELELTNVTVVERVVVWEPGVRLAFTVDRSTVPLVNRLLADMRFEPIDNGECRFVLTVHYEPSLAMRLVHPLAKRAIGKVWSTRLAALKEYIEAHPER